MDFYKEAKVYTLTNGSTLDLGPAEYKHKAAYISANASMGGAFSNAIVDIWFWSNGNINGPVSIAVADSSTDGTTSKFTNGIIPVRLAKVKVDTGKSCQITLLN